MDFTFLPLAAVPEFVSAHFGVIALVGIVLVGLAVGAADFLRLSPRRVWAIGSVGFRESIRRRVLWITPLAMLGIVAVTQLAHPFDEQDAIRQATKYCLFASGVVVVIATLILACTSLPKEIENRVIYTIVTKPATRLEIVLGKTLGFAGTSAVILLIMGLFSYAYLRVNAGQLASSVRARLASMGPDDPGRETLTHYAREGLLQARTYARPVALDIYAKLPQADDPYRWVYGLSEQSVLFPVKLPSELFDRENSQLVITLDVAVRQQALTRREIENEKEDPTATTRATTRGVEIMPGPATITVGIVNENINDVVAPAEIIDAMHLAPGAGANPNAAAKNANSVVLEPPGAPVGRAMLVVPTKSLQAETRLKAVPVDKDGNRRVLVMVTGLSPGTQYGFNEKSVALTAHLFDAAGKPLPPVAIPLKSDTGGSITPVFRGRLSTAGYQQLRGDTHPDHAPVAVYEYRGAEISGGGATVPFEFRTKVERSGAEATEAENITYAELVFVNRKTGYRSPPITITADSDRPTFFEAPREAVEGGDFDMTVRSRTDGHYVGLREGSVAVVAASHSFAGNLAKSLLILWMLSVLVVIVSIFCSTFVSWPIAVVLTLVILLGHWCVAQMGEQASAQSIYTDLFGQRGGAVEAKLFTSSLTALTKMLQTVSTVLPDMSRFRVTEDIERGVVITGSTMLDGLRVLAAFGVPLLILAYLFLRRKEVAP